MMKASGIYRNSRVAPDGTTRKRICGLTPREMDILEFMAAGYKDKEIAEKIFISFHTVRTHTKRIFQKLDVRTRVQAIQRAAELRVSSDSS
jgi:ATP/maltotriose-dependent transcriptional regulator MalT